MVINSSATCHLPKDATMKNNDLIKDLAPPTPTTTGGGHIVFGADFFHVGMTFLSAQYVLNQWLDSNQSFMDI